MSTAQEKSLPIQEVINLALMAGLCAHQSGGDVARTSAIMRRLALALGAERVETIISSSNIGLTLEKAGAHVTAFRKAPHMGANFTMLVSVSRLVVATESGRIASRHVHRHLLRIVQHPHFYPRPLIAAFVGVSCGGFSALFNGDVAAIVCTSVGSGLGMGVRLFLHRRHYMPFLFVLAASFTALTITGFLLRFFPSQTPEAALAASVLFLIPGVPFINGAADLFNAHYLNGMVRIMTGVIFVIGIATGVSLALRIL